MGKKYDPITPDFFAVGKAAEQFADTDVRVVDHKADDDCDMDEDD